jgi:hypothetical protein
MVLVAVGASGTDPAVVQIGDVSIDRTGVPRARLAFRSGARDNGALLRTIFSAHVGVIAPPVEYNNEWVLVLVRQLLPGRLEPLKNQRAKIVKLLTQRRRQVAVARFLTAYTKRWTARTSCSAGYIVPRCKQYDSAKRSGSTRSP